MLVLYFCWEEGGKINIDNGLEFLMGFDENFFVFFNCSLENFFFFLYIIIY